MIDGSELFWCLRCGTIRWHPLLPEKLTVDAAPKLVERVRKYRDQTFLDEHLWRSLGIEESIHRPEERKYT
jgi:hypothetical protein